MSAIIENVVSGDDLQIEEDVTGIEVTDPLIKAWLTIKTSPTVADPGTLQKVITVASVAGTGQITEDGSEEQGNGTGTVVFQFTGAETLTLGTTIRYYWDIQVKTNSGKIFTVADTDTGNTLRRIQWRKGVTDATT